MGDNVKKSKEFLGNLYGRHWLIMEWNSSWDKMISLLDTSEVEKALIACKRLMQEGTKKPVCAYKFFLLASKCPEK